MVVGTLELEIFIPGSSSLKDKRRIVKSLRDKVRAKFNVSIAEIDFQDKWQRALLGIAATNTDGGEIRNTLQRVKEVFEQQGECLIAAEKFYFFQTRSD
ncbi:MAG: DUF503 domain-containing protein [Candidatus Omnitrophica bacterium]|nr:DUF503 domain-containing protein [Candidatus Omnitrophota bacterium]